VRDAAAAQHLAQAAADAAAKAAMDIAIAQAELEQKNLRSRQLSAQMRLGVREARCSRGGFSA
jgi:hypothetical protein